MEAWRDHKVLIVDDSQFVREELADLYTELGMKVIGTAADGLAAIEQAEKLDPDLISLDIIMPEMDGVECYGHLVSLFPLVKILMVTALSAEPRVVNHFAETIDPRLYLGKPPSKEELMDKLGMLFNDGVVAEEPQENESALD